MLEIWRLEFLPSQTGVVAPTVPSWNHLFANLLELDQLRRALNYGVA